jgi:predicted transcriptional regulator
VLNKDLISASIPILSLNDTVFQAQQFMSDYQVSHLPVVANDQYLGLIGDEDLLNADEQSSMLQLQTHFLKLSVKANSHFIEAVQLANEYGLSVVPVVEPDMVWKGSIAATDLLKYLGHITGVDEPGGVIVLELEPKAFALSEICKLVETNDAQITQVNTYLDNNLGLLYVTMKVNKFEISDIVATFQRYEYHVKYYFGEELYENELKTNYDHLMNYLNI